MSLSKAQKWIVITVGCASLVSAALCGVKAYLGIDSIHSSIAGIQEEMKKHTLQIETLLIKVTRLETLNENKIYYRGAGHYYTNMHYNVQ
jgi:hypothetical protein